MRTYKGLALATFGAILCCLTAPVLAQVKHTVLNLTYVVPQGVDPGGTVIFTQFNKPIDLPGSELLQGVSFYGEVPGKPPNTLVDVDKVDFKFTFLGSTINTNVKATGGWLPWSTSFSQPQTHFFDIAFSANPPVGKQGGSAPINNFFYPNPNSTNPSFAFLTAAIKNDPTGSITDAFKNSIVVVTAESPGATRGPGGNVVPEAGTLLQLAICLLIGAVPLIYTRRTRSQVSTLNSQH